MMGLLFLYDHDSIVPYDPNLFTIGGFEVKKYAFCIMIGAILAFYLGLRWAKHLGIDEDVIYTGFAIGLVVGVLGTRIFYCMMDDFHKFITKPWTVITEFRNGGLAISGMIIFVPIFVYFYCKKVKIHPLYILEVVAPGFLIGQICGRWGNFFNQEAHGGLVPGFPDLDAQREWLKFLPDFIRNNMYITKLTTDAPYKGYYQPTFLYESIANLIGLGIILALRKWWKKYLVGDGAFLYCIWYGFVRVHIEIMRTDAQMIGNLKVAQLVGFLLFVGGLAGIILRHIFQYKPVLWSNPENINNSFGKIEQNQENK